MARPPLRKAARKTAAKRASPVSTKARIAVKTKPGKAPRQLKGVALEKALKLARVSHDTFTQYATPAPALRDLEIDKGLAQGLTETLRPRKLARAFSATRFADLLAHSLTADGVGFALQINRDGKPVAARANGYARSVADGGVRWDSDTRMHIASVSKFFSAVGLVKLLYKKGISFDRKVRDFLPSYWTIGPKAYFLTFHNILSHEHGLWTIDCAYADVKREIANAQSAIGEGNHYANSNYALMRILIPIINGDLQRDVDYGKALGFGISNDTAWDALTRKHFNDYMQENVWRPSGVSFASLKSTTALWNLPPFSGMKPYTDAAIGYGYPPVSTGTHGVDISSDLTIYAGAVGWHVSCNEILQVADKVRRRDGIISNRTLNQMFRLGYGFFGTHRNGNTAIHYHDGIWAASDVGETAYLGFIDSRYEFAVLNNHERDIKVRSLGLLRDRVHAIYDESMK